MKRLILAASVSAVLAAAAYSRTTSDLYSSDAGNFRVKFDRTPKTTALTVPSAGGPLKLTMAIDEPSHSNTYTVMYSDYPDRVADADPQRVLDGVVKGVSAQWNILEEKKILFEGSPGRDLVIELGGPKRDRSKGRALIVLVKTRLFHVVAVVPKTQDDAKSVDAFIGSFKLGLNDDKRGDHSPAKASLRRHGSAETRSGTR